MVAPRSLPETSGCLRARLADARHFWDRDLQTPLNELLPKLDGIVFHAKIGTQLARAERIATLAARDR